MQVQFSRSYRQPLLLTCALTIALSWHFEPSVWAQESVQIRPPDTILTIGSPAPSLDIEHWIHKGKGKFEPVTAFKNNRVYLVEFWATWHTYFVSTMPHLARLQDKYADQNFQIISISNESLVTVDQFLDRMVYGSQDEEATYRKLTRSYCLAADPDQSSTQQYMRASKQPRIPCSFLVGKSGVIEWIGDPMEVDEPLQRVLDDSWDRNAFKQKYLEDQRVTIFEDQVRALIWQGKLEEALAKIDDAIFKTDNPVEKDRYRSVKFVVLEVLARSSSHTDELGAYIQSVLADEKMQPECVNWFAWHVYNLQVDEQKFKDPAVIEATIASLTKAIKRADENVFDMWYLLAHLQEISGDLRGALQSSTKAIELGSMDQQKMCYEFLQALLETTEERIRTASKSSNPDER